MRALLGVTVELRPGPHVVGDAADGEQANAQAERRADPHTIGAMIEEVAGSACR
jgi:hypothetical protein